MITKNNYKLPVEHQFLVAVIILLKRILIMFGVIGVNALLVWILPLHENPVFSLAIYVSLIIGGSLLILLHFETKKDITKKLQESVETKSKVPNTYRRIISGYSRCKQAGYYTSARTSSDSKHIKPSERSRISNASRYGVFSYINKTIANNKVLDINKETLEKLAFLQHTKWINDKLIDDWKNLIPKINKTEGEGNAINDKEFQEFIKTFDIHKNDPGISNKIKFIIGYNDLLLQERDIIIKDQVIETSYFESYRKQKTIDYLNNLIRINQELLKPIITSNQDVKNKK